MGISIYVGMYARSLEGVPDHDTARTIETQLNKINRVLSEHGIDEHIEPRTIGDYRNRSGCDDFSYSNLAQLKSFYIDRQLTNDLNITYDC